jgi:hypothetical protein
VSTITSIDDLNYCILCMFLTFQAERPIIHSIRLSSDVVIPSSLILPSLVDDVMNGEKVIVLTDYKFLFRHKKLIKHKKVA